MLTATLDDRPGELGRYCRKLADSGVAISSAYVAKRGGGETELILAVDDLDGSRPGAKKPAGEPAGSSVSASSLGRGDPSTRARAGGAEVHRRGSGGEVQELVGAVEPLLDGQPLEDAQQSEDDDQRCRRHR